MTEQKILFVSQNPTVRSMVCETLLSLIFPCVWSFVVIPVLPDQMLEFIQAPVPYILGVGRVTKEMEDHLAGGDVVVFDVDTCRFVGISSSPSFTRMPKAVRESAANAWSEMDAADGFGDRKVNYTERETKMEKRFRVSLSLALSSFIKKSEDVLSQGPGSPSYEFASKVSLCRVVPSTKYIFL